MSPIIDLIIRIKNGYLAGRESINTPYSKFREAVLIKLKKLNYIDDFKVVGNGIKKITIMLSTDDSKRFTDVKPVSKPGQRIYVAVNDLKPVMSGLGYAIISTPKGIKTNIEAKREQIGGELLFYIW